MSGSKVLVVVGATGNQGNSVAKYVLKDPQLSKEFTVRAITRDPTKPAGEELAKLGAQVIKADIDDPESVSKAFSGADFVFAMTVTTYDEHKKERELRQGKTMCDEAIKAGVKYFIFSTLPSMSQISGGKYKKGEHFDSKYEVEQYIRSKPIKSAFFAPGCFMENFHNILSPRLTGDKYTLTATLKPDTKVPYIDVEDDAGKYVSAILKNPNQFEGKILCSATELLTMSQVVEIISKRTGKEVVYNQIPTDALRGFLTPYQADDLCDMFDYFNDFGYYGPDTASLVHECSESVKQPLTTLSQYLELHPLDLSN